MSDFTLPPAGHQMNTFLFAELELILHEKYCFFQSQQLKMENKSETKKVFGQEV